MKSFKRYARSIGRCCPKAIFVIAFAAFSITSLVQAAFAQVAPSLGTAQSFGVLAGSTVTNTGSTIITGDLGVSPGTAITGFPPGTEVGGTVSAGDAVALQAEADTTTAYNNLAAQACNTTYSTPTDIGGLTLTPGVYCFASSAGLTGTVTLDGQGNPNAVFIFEIGSTLITASNSAVVLINGAEPCSVFWQVGSSATLGTGTAFLGNILASASITLDANATLSGRALAESGAVTLSSNTVSVTSCSVTTLVPPTLNKTFSPGSILTSGVSTLTITLSNPNSTAASLTSALTDALPSGVVISGSASSTCGGTVTATAGGSSVSLSGGSIPANGSCTVTVGVTAAAAGSDINTLAAGALQTTNGANVTPAVATLTVTAPVPGPPTVNKSFSPGTISAGGASLLTITLSNPDTTVASLTAPLTDNLPSGLLVSGNGNTTCGGTVTAVAGSSSVSLSGGTIPANGSCTLTADVTAAITGSYFNSLPIGALQTGNGSNAQPVVATLTVIPVPVIPPTLAKSFSPTRLSGNETSTLTITLTNGDSESAKLTAPLTDHLPPGMLVAGSGTNTCGGTLSASSGSSMVSLTGGSIPADGACTVTVAVTGSCSVSQQHRGIIVDWLNGGCTLTNTLPAGALQTSNGSNSQSASAILSAARIVRAPELQTDFTPSSIHSGDDSRLYIVLVDLNSKPSEMTAPLTDHLPTGMSITSVIKNTCGGVLTAAEGSSTITLTGGTIPARGHCEVTVDVTASCSSNSGCKFTNTLAAGALQTNDGNNSGPVVATLTVKK
jgi:hypothetical protein